MNSASTFFQNLETSAIGISMHFSAVASDLAFSTKPLLLLPILFTHNSSLAPPTIASSA
jgi:hypothetical protein